MELRVRLMNGTRWMAWVVFLSAMACFIGLYGTDASILRGLLSIVLFILLMGLSLHTPAAALLLLVIIEPLLGLTRRLLIPMAGWSSLDPLVILAPVTVLLMGSYWFYRVYVLRQEEANDTIIFRLLRWMLLINLLEVVNPLQGSVTVGLGGVIFYVVPLLWMILSREYVDNQWFSRILGLTFFLGVLIALYGLKQTYWGFYPFEQAWIHLTNIVSMNVDGSVRAVSTLTSAQEYAMYMGIAMMIGWFYLLYGKIHIKFIALVGLGILGWALFMESVRGTIVTAALGLGFMTILSGKGLRRRIFMLLFISVVFTVMFIEMGHIHSSNGLVSHNIQGLSNPLNNHDSSLSGHYAIMLNGIVEGLKQPIGYGLGSTTTAAGKFSSGNLGTEVDVSNMFVSDGVIGGVLYLVLMGFILFSAVKQAIQGEKLGLLVLGVLLVAGGQWLNGELYSTSALVWIVVGQLDRFAVNARMNTG